MNTDLKAIIRERYGMSVTQFCGNQFIQPSVLYKHFQKHNYDFDFAVATAKAAYCTRTEARSTQRPDEAQHDD